jgi:hypothetical protein
MTKPVVFSVALALLSACCGAAAATADSDAPATLAAAEDAPTALSARHSDACPGRTTATDLFDIITNHLKWVGTCYDVAANRCGDFTARRCERAVSIYRRQLVDARHDLRRASVPAELERPNRTMRRALRTALRATRIGLRAIRGEDLEDWLAALGLHARAALRLRLARDQLALVRP